MDAKSGKLSSSSESAFIFFVDFLIGKMLPDVLTSMKEVWNIETFHQ